MDFGVFMFHTDYSMPIVDLAQACEARGFESLWAPEHSHIPLTRKTPFPGGTELPKMYYDAMDPFVILSAAAAAAGTRTRWRITALSTPPASSGCANRSRQCARSGPIRSPNTTAKSST